MKLTTTLAFTALLWTTAIHAEDGFLDGKQGHCWACMHGCTPKQDAEYCDWPGRTALNQPLPGPVQPSASGSSCKGICLSPAADLRAR